MAENKCVDLLNHRLAKMHVTGSVNPMARVICDLIDMFNEQHWHDRNLYGTEVRRLTEENKDLRERIEKLEGRTNG